MDASDVQRNWYFPLVLFRSVIHRLHESAYIQ